MAKHSSLGPSSAKRWINCPGSIGLIERLPLHERNRSSSYANEGSAAHALGEACLRESRQPEEYLGCWIVADPLQQWRIAGSGEIEKRQDNPEKYEITNEMVEHVAVYVDTVRQDWAELGPGTELEVEQRVQPVAGIENLWGTADAILYRPLHAIRVYDFKYGAGVVVEVEANEQASCYGLGALNKVGGALDVDEVQLVIVQPRALHEDGVVRRWNVDPIKLADWGDVLTAAAKRTEDPNAPLQTGDWCQFCPALARCPQAKTDAEARALTQFSALTAPASPTEIQLPMPTTPEEVAQILFYAPVIDSWLRSVKAGAQRALEHGEIIPGHKLVRKKSNRAWENEARTSEELQVAGVPEDRYMEPRVLQSPAQIEKLADLGKPAERKAFVAALAFKPEGGLTITHESDPREAVAAPLLTQFAALAPSVRKTLSMACNPDLRKE